MKRLMSIVFAGSLVGLPLSAFAYDNDEYAKSSYSGYESTGEFRDRGKVIRVKPVYETITVNEPVTECWIEKRKVNKRHSGKPLAAGIVGGIIGGVAGHQIGDGRGQDVATVAGTIVGTTIGYNMGKKHSHKHKPAYYEHEVCETVNRTKTQERLVGYRVEYRYKGQTFVTHTDHKPGGWIPLRVNVRPA